MSDPLWFFWGQDTMTWLRYLTLQSAKRVHDDVRLVVRNQPPTRAQYELRQEETQPHEGHNWLPDAISLLGKQAVIDLREIAPAISQLDLPGVPTSDLLSFFLMAEYGGSVADMDILFIRELPQIVEDVQIPVWGESWNLGWHIPAAFYQGRPCAEWRDAYDRSYKNAKPGDYFCCSPWKIEFMPNLKGPMRTAGVYPWANGDAPLAKWNKYNFHLTEWPQTPDECFGNHWYAGCNPDIVQLVTGPDVLEGMPGAVAAMYRTIKWRDG